MYTFLVNINLSKIILCMINGHQLIYLFNKLSNKCTLADVQDTFYKIDSLFTIW